MFYIFEIRLEAHVESKIWMKHQTNEISLNFRSFINNMLYEEVIGS